MSDLSGAYNDEHALDLAWYQWIPLVTLGLVAGIVVLPCVAVYAWVTAKDREGEHGT